MTTQVLNSKGRAAGVLGRSGQVECAAAKSCTGLRQIRLIAAKEFGDRLRSGWVVACMTVWLGAICLTSFFGLIQIGHIGAQGYERTVISLLNLVQYLVPLLGLLLGHDLVVSEHEERTIKLILASGVSRSRLLFGKFLGGCLTLTVPLVSGFLIAGAAIGLATNDYGFTPFIRLAISGLGLGILFVALGLTISVLSRSRVQALVISLLAWCLFVFVFDLAALALVVSSRAPSAAHEIEVICDATHVNAAVDIHSALETATDARTGQAASTRQSSSMLWLALNPVDLFRAVNLSRQTGIELPFIVILGSCTLWLALNAAVSFSKFRKTDL